MVNRRFCLRLSPIRPTAQPATLPLSEGVGHPNTQLCHSQLAWVDLRRPQWPATGGAWPSPAKKGTRFAAEFLLGPVAGVQSILPRALRMEGCLAHLWGVECSRESKCGGLCGPTCAGTSGGFCMVDRLFQHSSAAGRAGAQTAGLSSPGPPGSQDTALCHSQLAWVDLRRPQWPATGGARHTPATCGRWIWPEVLSALSCARLTRQPLWATDGGVSCTPLKG